MIAPSEVPETLMPGQKLGRASILPLSRLVIMHCHLSSTAVSGSSHYSLAGHGMREPGVHTPLDIPPERDLKGAATTNKMAGKK